jgi:hypothetical protein
MISLVLSSKSKYQKQKKKTLLEQVHKSDILMNLKYKRDYCVFFKVQFF